MSDSRKNIQHYKIFDYWKDKAITNNGDIVDVNDEKYFSSSVEVVYDWGEPECFACRKLVAPVLDDKDYEQWLEDEEVRNVLIENGYTPMPRKNGNIDLSKYGF